MGEIKTMGTGTTILLIGIPILVYLIYLICTFFSWECLDSGDFFAGIIPSGISFLLTLLALIIISMYPNSELQKVETTTISALKDNAKTKGSFFLGSGYINSNQYYFYIEETNKGKKMSKVSVDNAYVKENSTRSYIERYEYQYTSKFAIWMYGKEPWGAEEYIFHVPKGTVTTEFNIDME
jgi:hypothetical protein